jgi:osmotically-inducible protein OsmY
MKVHLSSIRGGCLALVLAAAPVLADAPDAWLTTKAKIALLTTDGVSVTAVNVDTVNGNVTLHGKVKSEGEKAKAAMAVGAVDGVKSVHNLLQVVPDAVRPTLKLADDTIKSNIESSLKLEPTLRDVKVASVNNGVTLLSGKTHNLADKLRAIEVAWAVQGVQRVASEIETVDK